jgi:hypothetical protein
MFSADYAKALSQKAIDNLSELWYDRYMNVAYKTIKEATDNGNYRCWFNLKLNSYYHKDKQKAALDRLVKELQDFGYKVSTTENERHILVGRVLNYDVWVNWEEDEDV